MRALVVAAHPDDEVLGAGATMASMSAAGDEVHVLILAEGVSLRVPGLTLSEAQANCRRAADRLGVQDISFGGFASNGVLIADVPQRPVVAAVEHAVARMRPEVVFTHHPGDIHADHRVVARSVQYVTRFLGLGRTRAVLHFEVPSSTDQQFGTESPFVPNYFTDVTGFVTAKCEALSVYDYEVFDAPHPRSLVAVSALAVCRGAQVGVSEAEAFVLGRALGRVAHPEIV